MSEQSGTESYRISQQCCQGAIVNLGKSSIGGGKYCHRSKAVNSLLSDVSSSNCSHQGGEPLIIDQSLEDSAGSCGRDGDSWDDTNTRSARFPRDIMDGWLGIGFWNHGCQCNIVNWWSVTFGCKVWICWGVRFWIGVVSCWIF